MQSRKIASNLLWTPEGFVRHPLVTVGGDGRIERVEVCAEPDRSACTEFYAGILTPAFVDAGASGDAAAAAGAAGGNGRPSLGGGTAAPMQSGASGGDSVSVVGPEPVGAAASADGAAQHARRDFLCVRSAADYDRLVGTGRAAQTTVCLGADPASPDPLGSMLGVLASVRGVPLHELIGWATRNGALALGIGRDAGTVEAGKRCGLCLLRGLDYERLALTPASAIRRIL